MKNILGQTLEAGWSRINNFGHFPQGRCEILLEDAWRLNLLAEPCIRGGVGEVCYFDQNDRLNVYFYPGELPIIVMDEQKDAAMAATVWPLHEGGDYNAPRIDRDHMSGGAYDHPSAPDDAEGGHGDQ